MPGAYPGFVEWERRPPVPGEAAGVGRLLERDTVTGGDVFFARLAVERDADDE